MNLKHVMLILLVLGFFIGGWFLKDYLFNSIGGLFGSIVLIVAFLAFSFIVIKVR